MSIRCRALAQHPWPAGEICLESACFLDEIRFYQGKLRRVLEIRWKQVAEWPEHRSLAVLSASDRPVLGRTDQERAVYSFTACEPCDELVRLRGIAR